MLFSNKNFNTKKGIDNYIDIDKYFYNLIEQRIKQNEQEMKIRPEPFKKIVKRHEYHMSNEEIDKSQFKFYQKVLFMKSKENLNKKSELQKDTPNSVLVLKNQIKDDILLLEEKNRIPKKLEQSHGLKDSQRSLSVAKLDNRFPEKYQNHPKEKIKLSCSFYNVKEQNNPNIKSAKIIEENVPIKNRSSSFQNQKNNALRNKTPEIVREKNNSNQRQYQNIIEKRRLIALETKDLIQSMIENIEKNLVKDKKSFRVNEQNNKPSNDLKIQEKLVRNQNELSRSTINSSIKENDIQKLSARNEMVKLPTNCSNSDKTSSEFSIQKKFLYFK